MNLNWLEIVISSLFVIIILMMIVGKGTSWLEPRFWRNASIVSVCVMTIVLIFLTFDSVSKIKAGSDHVPNYNVINNKIGYVYSAKKLHYVPTIGEKVGIFGKIWSDKESYDLVNKGKKTIQARNCMECHTLLGNGAYYAPDLTKAWLDPMWKTIMRARTQTTTTEDAMVKFLQNPEKYASWNRKMPNLHLTNEEVRAVVVFLKYMSTIDTNGFPDHFGVAVGQ